MKDNESNVPEAFVGLLYGFLFLLLGFLLKNNADKDWNSSSFWYAFIGVWILIEVLKILAVRLKNYEWANLVSVFVIELGTITICTIFGLIFVTVLEEVNLINSLTTLVVIGFCFIFFSYELSIHLGKVLKYQLGYRKLKKEFEEKYNMVNLLTVLATILTLMIMAKGAETSSKEVLLSFFLSCSFIYVLLIHYCFENRLNERK